MLSINSNLISRSSANHKAKSTNWGNLVSGRIQFVICLEHLGNITEWLQWFQYDHYHHHSLSANIFFSSVTKRAPLRFLLILGITDVVFSLYALKGRLFGLPWVGTKGRSTNDRLTHFRSLSHLQNFLSSTKKGIEVEKTSSQTIKDCILTAVDSHVNWQWCE